MALDRQELWHQVRALRGDRDAELDRRRAVWAAVRVLTEAGHSVNDIAAAIGVHPRTVQRYRGQPEPIAGSGPRMFGDAGGLTHREIAERLGLDVRTVRRLLAMDRPPPRSLTQVVTDLAAETGVSRTALWRRLVPPEQLEAAAARKRAARQGRELPQLGRWDDCA